MGKKINTGDLCITVVQIIIVIFLVVGVVMIGVNYITNEYKPYHNFCHTQNYSKATDWNFEYYPRMVTKIQIECDKEKIFRVYKDKKYEMDKWGEPHQIGFEYKIWVWEEWT